MLHLISTFTPLTSHEQGHMLCDDCSCGVANDDWSHIDFFAFDQEEADEEYVRVTASLEALGELSHSHKSERVAYFTCAVCDDIQCGNPQIWVGGNS